MPIGCALLGTSILEAGIHSIDVSHFLDNMLLGGGKSMQGWKHSNYPGNGVDILVDPMLHESTSNH